MAGAGVEQAGGKVGGCTVHRQVACCCISQLRSSLGNQNQETCDLFSRINIYTYLDVEHRSQVLSSFGTCAKNWLAQHRQLGTFLIYECTGVFQCSTCVSNNYIVLIWIVTLKNNLRSWQFRQDILAEFSGWWGEHQPCKRVLYWLVDIFSWFWKATQGQGKNTGIFGNFSQHG